eukprot:scaffold110994_cov18-Tisochrysis_lutea.AAC.1
MSTAKQHAALLHMLTCLHAHATHALQLHKQGMLVAKQRAQQQDAVQQWEHCQGLWGAVGQSVCSGVGKAQQQQQQQQQGHTTEAMPDSAPKTEKRGRGLWRGLWNFGARNRASHGPQQQEQQQEQEQQQQQQQRVDAGQQHHHHQQHVCGEPALTHTAAACGSRGTFQGCFHAGQCHAATWAPVPAASGAVGAEAAAAGGAPAAAWHFHAAQAAHSAGGAGVTLSAGGVPAVLTVAGTRAVPTAAAGG